MSDTATIDVRPGQLDGLYVWSVAFFVDGVQTHGSGSSCWGYDAAWREAEAAVERLRDKAANEPWRPPGILG